jgi:uncharacterized membrane protein
MDILLLIIAFAAAVSIVIWLYFKVAPPMSNVVRWILIALRICLFIVLALLLMNISWTSPSSVSVEKNVIIAVDDSASMEIKDIGADLENASSRREIQNRLIFGEGSGLINTISKAEAQPRVFAFSEDFRQIPANKGIETAEGGITSFNHLFTKLNAAVNDQTSAIIIVSDGVDNGGGGLQGKYGNLNIPIYTIGVGSEIPPADIRVSRVLAPSLALRDKTVTVTLIIGQDGFGGHETEWVLTLNDEIIRRENIKFDTLKKEIRFELVPDREGLLSYSIFIPVEAGEFSSNNNRHDFKLEVAPEQIKVLLAFSRPSWDYAFLYRNLIRDKGLVVESVLPVKASDSIDWNEIAGKINDYDVVILGNIDLAAIPRESADSFADYITRRGGGLILLGGPETFSSANKVNTSLASLLPFTLIPSENSYRLNKMKISLPAKSLSHPIFKSRWWTREELAKAWNDAPNLRAVNRVSELVPGAEVLASLVFESTEYPLAVLRNSGDGRVMAWTTDDGWRFDFAMRSIESPYYLYRDIWAETIRYMAGRQTSRQLNVSVIGDEIVAGKLTILQAQLIDPSLLGLDSLTLQAEIKSDEGYAKTVKLNRVPGSDSVFRSAVTFDYPGRYLIKSQANRGDIVLGVDKKEIDVAVWDLEMKEIRMNRELLETVASETGGTFFSYDSADQVGAKLDLKPEVLREVRRNQLIQWPGMIFICIILLTAEWMIRRKSGLK